MCVCVPNLLSPCVCVCVYVCLHHCVYNNLLEAQGAVSMIIQTPLLSVATYTLYNIYTCSIILIMCTFVNLNEYIIIAIMTYIYPQAY